MKRQCSTVCEIVIVNAVPSLQFVHVLISRCFNLSCMLHKIWCHAIVLLRLYNHVSIHNCTVILLQGWVHTMHRWVHHWLWWVEIYDQKPCNNSNLHTETFWNGNAIDVRLKTSLQTAQVQVTRNYWISYDTSAEPAPNNWYNFVHI